MRKVIVSVYTTLDGVMEGLEEWPGQFSNEEHGVYARDLLFGSDALLMGRETYEIFAASWPLRTAADDDPGAEGFVDRMNSLPKFVASTTLREPLAWNNARLIAGDLAEAISTLKRQPGQNILMYGAGPVALTLMRNGLIDELRVWVHPLIWGNGAHLFGGATDLPLLNLTDTRRFTSGVVVLSYQPVRAASSAS